MWCIGGETVSLGPLVSNRAGYHHSRGGPWQHRTISLYSKSVEFQRSLSLLETSRTDPQQTWRQHKATLETCVNSKATKKTGRKEKKVWRSKEKSTSLRDRLSPLRLPTSSCASSRRWTSSNPAWAANVVMTWRGVLSNLCKTFRGHW